MIYGSQTSYLFIIMKYTSPVFLLFCAPRSHYTCNSAVFADVMNPLYFSSLAWTGPSGLKYRSTISAERPVNSFGSRSESISSWTGFFLTNEHSSHHMIRRGKCKGCLQRSHSS